MTNRPWREVFDEWEKQDKEYREEVISRMMNAMAEDRVAAENLLLAMESTGLQVLVKQ